MKYKKAKEIIGGKVSVVSLVKKGANKQVFSMVKSSDDPDEKTWERYVPIVKTEKEKRLVTGVVYKLGDPWSNPEDLDTDNEFITSFDVIEKMAHDYMIDSQAIDSHHDYVQKDVAVVESYVTKGDTSIGDIVYPEGTWLMTCYVSDDETWEQVQKGEIKGYSMAGLCKKKEHIIPIEKSEKESSIFERIQKGVMEVLASAGIIPKEEPVNFKTKMEQRKARSNINDANWIFWDTISDILNNAELTAEEKKTNILANVDSLKEFISGELSTIENVEKMEKSVNELSEEVIEKAGKVFSNANYSQLEKIKNMVEELISKAKTEEEGEEEEMKAEDIAKMSELIQKSMKEVVGPLAERLEGIEKSIGVEGAGAEEGTPGEKSDDEKMVELIQKSMKEVIDPLSERLSKIEKSRGLSNQLPNTEEAVEKQQKMEKGSGKFGSLRGSII